MNWDERMRGMDILMTESESHFAARLRTYAMTSPSYRYMLWDIRVLAKDGAISKAEALSRTLCVFYKSDGILVVTEELSGGHR